MLIIWITWTLGAWKWTIVDFLKQNYWFWHLSVREFLTDEIKKRNLPINRDSMVLVANELRTQFWPDHIASQLYNKALQTDKPQIIESIRTLWEIQTLRNKWDFILFAIDADPEIRYNRITSRASETDQVSFDEFIMNEQREMNNTDPTKQNLAWCIAQADFIFNNNSTLQDLQNQIDQTMTKIINKPYLKFSTQ